jgi:putative DNA primase/helicase
MLYSDDDENIIRVSRPQIINGIGDLLHNSDLIDRSIFVRLERIPDADRRPLDEIRTDFERVKPQILGGLCDAVSEALGNYAKVKSQAWPRMANFAKWVTAAEGKLHLPDGQTFLAAYNYNRQAAHQLAIEGSEFAMTLIDICRDDGGFDATAGDVLDKVNAKASDTAKRSKYWPSTPKSCSNHIRRLSPNLAANGIEVEYLTRKNNKRLIRFTVTTVTPSPESDASDASDCHPLIPFEETA